MASPAESTVPVQSNTLTQGSGPRTIAYTALVNGVPTLVQQQVVVLAHPDGTLIEDDGAVRRQIDTLNCLRDIKQLLLAAQGLSVMDGELDRATQ